MTALLAAFATVAAFGALVLRTLRVPLLTVLIEVCAGEHRARFWWRVAAAELVFGTGLCSATALALDGSHPRGWLSAVAVVRGGLAGLLLSLIAITVATVLVGRFQTSSGGAATL